VTIPRRSGLRRARPSVRVWCGPRSPPHPNTVIPGLFRLLHEQVCSTFPQCVRRYERSDDDGDPGCWAASVTCSNRPDVRNPATPGLCHPNRLREPIPRRSREYVVDMKRPPAARRLSDLAAGVLAVNIRPRGLSLKSSVRHHFDRQSRKLSDHLWQTGTTGGPYSSSTVDHRSAGRRTQANRLNNFSFARK